jgi:hypothetical protein
MNAQQLQKAAETIYKFAPQCNQENVAVSNSNVGWHVAHSLLVFNGVINLMQASQAGEYKPKASIIKFYVMLLGKIPRGKGKSPNTVIPNNEQLNNEGLRILFLKATAKLTEFENLQTNQFFNHPYFGHLNKATAAKFLTIHTNHHLAIIKDIIASK